MKICLVCSHGGHLTEMIEILDAFSGHDIFFITYPNSRNVGDYRMYYTDNLGKNPWRFIASLPAMLGILLKEKPDLIVSTGAEIAIPAFYLGSLLGIRTLFIESLCRVKHPSATGKIVYPVSTVFLVQWEHLLQRYGKKAMYRGNII